MQRNMDSDKDIKEEEEEEEAKEGSDHGTTTPPRAIPTTSRQQRCLSAVSAASSTGSLFGSAIDDDNDDNEEDEGDNGHTTSTTCFGGGANMNNSDRTDIVDNTSVSISDPTTSDLFTPARAGNVIQEHEIFAAHAAVAQALRESKAASASSSLSASSSTTTTTAAAAAKSASTTSSTSTSTAAATTAKTAAATTTTSPPPAAPSSVLHTTKTTTATNSPILMSRPKPQQQHDRKISWGALPTAAATATTTGDSNSHNKSASPPPNNNNTSSSSPPNNNTSNINATINNRVRLGSADVNNVNNRLRLGSVTADSVDHHILLSTVHPLEQEAETHILSSLEAMEARNEIRLGSAGAGGDRRPQILEFVPQEAEGLFLDDLTAHGGDAPSIGGGQQQPSSGLLPNRPRTFSRGDRQRTMEQQRAEQQQQQQRAAGHRRTTTVEQDLFSLTNALQAIHQQGPPNNNNVQPQSSSSNLGASGTSGGTDATTNRRRTSMVVLHNDSSNHSGHSHHSHQHQRHPSNEHNNNNNGTNTMMMMHPDQAIGLGSADLLAANAALLFRRRRPSIGAMAGNASGSGTTIGGDSHHRQQQQHLQQQQQQQQAGLVAASSSADQGSIQAAPSAGTDGASASVSAGKSRWRKLQLVVSATSHHKKTDSFGGAGAAESLHYSQSSLGVGAPGAGGDRPESLNSFEELSILDMEQGSMNHGTGGTTTGPGMNGINRPHENGHGNIQSSSSPPLLNNNSNSNKKKKNRIAMMLEALWQRQRATKIFARDFVKQQRVTSLMVALALVVPLVGIALILFYLCGNPPTGIITIIRAENGTVISQDPVIVDPSQPSHSWWLLFAARQLLTFALARATEVLVIDLFCLRLRWINVFKSPFLTLLFVQSRGWPFRATAWAIYDLIILHGEGPFARHWLFYQGYLRVFNESNPSGYVTSETLYTQIIALFLTIGIATSFKRVYVGFMQGKRVFATYGDEVAKVMRQVLLISQVGILARDIENARIADEARLDDRIWEKVEEQFDLHPGASDDENASKASKGTNATNDNPALVSGRDGYNESFNSSQKMKITELLGAWEDPEREDNMGEIEHNISVSSILQFRQSFALFNVRDSFGYFFGPTDTREHCIQSSEDVYERLLYRSNRKDTLSFHVLAILALNADGTLKQDTIKELIKIFRPQRDGSLSVLDFVKSVDTVYKRLKLLRASIAKTQRLDQAVERIFNIGFFSVVGVIALAVVGIDPMALFLSLSSIILAFAFMIGSASAKYFEGLLFILVRKPYGVGDRVFFNAADQGTNTDGSAGWFVRDITLYHTTLVFGATNECCTVANGTLANLRVVNAARSPKAILYIYLKFGTDVPWSKIQIFEKALRAFVQSRPREWLGVSGFLTTRVDSSLGFHEMVLVLQHRESWQSALALQVSKGEVTAYCHELQKKMDMRYKSPPLPVDLAMNQSADPLAAMNNKGNDGSESVVAKFAGPLAGQHVKDTSLTDYDSVAMLFKQKSDKTIGDS